MSANEVLVTVVGLLLGYWLVSYVLLALGGKRDGAPASDAEADRQTAEADRQTTAARDDDRPP